MVYDLVSLKMEFGCIVHHVLNNSGIDYDVEKKASLTKHEAHEQRLREKQMQQEKEAHAMKCAQGQKKLQRFGTNLCRGGQNWSVPELGNHSE